MFNVIVNVTIVEWIVVTSAQKQGAYLELLVATSANVLRNQVLKFMSELPDLKPWFDNESDQYDELPVNDEYSYDE